MKYASKQAVIFVLSMVALSLLAAPILVLAQSTYTYPGTGRLVNQDGSPVNSKRYTSSAECEADAWAETDRRKAAQPGIVVAAVECIYAKGFVKTWPTPTVPPPATTSGLGRLPDNPRINVGFSEERIQPTSEVAMPASDGQGDFRTKCQPSHFAFDDPIVFPGQVGKSHLHVFFGNTLSSASSTAESLRTTGNSTCRGGTVNRSSYWVPAMVDTTTNLPVVPQERGKERGHHADARWAAHDRRRPHVNRRRHLHQPIQIPLPQHWGKPKPEHPGVMPCRRLPGVQHRLSPVLGRCEPGQPRP
jgi:hypothetical protein